MKKRFLLVAGMFVASIIGATFNFNNHKAYATVPGTNKLISVNASGTVAMSTDTSGGRVSGNGKFVAFSNNTNNTVSGDNNYKSDVFVRNINANTTSRVSVSTSGVQGDGDSTSSIISETGRYAVFSSNASNLIDSVTTPTTYNQLYLRDTVANTTTLISKTTSGVLADSAVHAFDISSDGRFVLFYTGATNLGPTKSNIGSNIYMLDRSDGSFAILNYKYDGTLPDTNYGFFSAEMSCDGSLVVFIVSPLLTNTTSSHGDIYLLDRRAGSKLTNLTSTFNGAVQRPTISCNGNYIGFASYAYNIDPTFTSNPSAAYHPYVYDRINSTYSMVERSTSGTTGGGSDRLTISDNGIVAFATNTDLTSSGATGKQVYVRELSSGVTELLSRDSSGTPGNLHSNYPTISNNGSIVSYASTSTNLVSQTDTNSFTDAFTSLTGY